MITSYFLLLLAAEFVSAQHTSNSKQQTIVGKNMDIKDAPWQVSVQVDGKHRCSGSIYSKLIIITAAHCFFKEYTGHGTVQPPHHNARSAWDAKEFIIHAGSALKRYGNVIATVSAIMYHEGWQHHDIGIMKLTSSLPISKVVKTIDLATENPAPGSTVSSTGWGVLRDHWHPEFIHPEILQEIEMDVTECSPFGLGHGYPYQRTSNSSKSYICAKPKGHKACLEDPGGAVVLNKKLVGFPSRPKHYNGYGSRSVCHDSASYISVPHYHKWLMNAINSI